MNDLIEQLNACLPQTQCTLCGYPDCKSYATALATQETDDLSLCVPGAERAVHSLCATLNQSTEPHLSNLQYKDPVDLYIDPNQCIGCMKCVQACPTDAIIGLPKRLHAIIESECTGCERCIPKCPVDCIHTRSSEHNSTSALYRRASYHQDRYEQHQHRIQAQQQQFMRSHQAAKAGFDTNSAQDSLSARKKRIEAALKRNTSKSKPHHDPSH
ncbi:MAG: ferredoxin [Legionellales bacterium]|nr:ferredoxin [Legionellales bacterium]